MVYTANNDLTATGSTVINVTQVFGSPTAFAGYYDQGQNKVALFWERNNDLDEGEYHIIIDGDTDNIITSIWWSTVIEIDVSGLSSGNHSFTLTYVATDTTEYRAYPEPTVTFEL